MLTIILDPRDINCEVRDIVPNGWVRVPPISLYSVGKGNEGEGLKGIYMEYYHHNTLTYPNIAFPYSIDMF